MGLLGTKRAGLQDQRYYQKVLEHGPIAYWRLYEESGTVAADLVNSAQNGAYTGVTLAQPGIGDGRTCPLFDGAASIIDAHTATLAGAFNSATGAVIAWMRVSAAGIWTDGNAHYVCLLYVDAGNYVVLNKHTVNGQFVYSYRANAVSETVVESGISTTDWTCVGITWDKTGSGNAIAYRDGAQVGAAQNIAQVWAGALTTATVGASPGPANVWSGRLAHVALFDRALSAGEMAEIMVV